MTTNLRRKDRRINSLVSALLVSFLWAGQASAHLMVAQTGTLNIVGNDAFMALSIPTSALENVDQDDDQQISLFEFNRRRNDIIVQIQQAIGLETKEASAVLHDLRLVPVRPHSNDSVYISQLIVMGRFELPNSIKMLNFRMALFGENPKESRMKVTAKHPHSGQESVVLLTPAAPSRALFTSVVAQQDHPSSRP
jgi:hypothetical protein